jgi:hypothetical protein
MFTEDLSIFLDETQFAVPVVALGVSGSGIFDMPGEYVGPDGIFVSDECQIRVLRSVYGSLKYGDPVTVSGQSFEVRDARPVFDGVFVQVFLKRVATAALARILLEDGGYMLTEDGGYVLLEA